MNNDFNGWRNRETWCANLWIENDQGLYETVLDFAKTSLHEHADSIEEAISCTADSIENFITELLDFDNIFEMPKSQARELFRMLTDIGDLDRVYWDEIAKDGYLTELLSEECDECGEVHTGKEVEANA